LPAPLILGSPGGAIAAKGLLSGAAAFASKFAGPLASFAGNLFGSGGDKSNLDRHFIRRRVRDAQEAGIHPLYALGAGGGYSPVINTGGSSVGEALRQTGSLFDHIRSESAAKAAAGLSDRIAEAQIRQLNASASRDETAAQLALSEHALNTQAMAAQNRDRIGTMLDSAIANSSEAFGIPDKPLVRATRRVVLPNGDVVRIVDQDVAETGEIIGNAITLNSIDKWLMDKVTQADRSLRAHVTQPFRSAKEAFHNWYRRATAPRKNRSNPKYQHRR